MDTNTHPTVAVLGVGGVGGFLAAALAHAGVPVTGIVRSESAAADLRKTGLHVHSPMLGDFQATPPFAARLESPVSLLIIATKAYHLACAMNQIAPQAIGQALILPLLNGLDHMPLLRQRFGDRVAAGSIRIETKWEGNGHIRHASSFAIITLAAGADISPASLNHTADLLRRAGIEVRIGRSEQTVLWDKLTRLSVLAMATGVSGHSLGELRTDPVWRTRLQDALRETTAVAAAEGSPQDPAEHMRVIDTIAPSFTTSFARDIAAGRPTELDAIGGAVLRAAQRNGLRCPVMQTWIDELERKTCQQP